MKNELKHIVPDLSRARLAFSLVELLVVLGIIAALAAIAIPSIKAMQKSFDSTGAESMISTALSAARTIAISKGKYAGVRFQKIYNGNNVFDADQYMIFIVFDNDDKVTNWKCGFVAVEGYKPIKLPSNTEVIDKMIIPGRSETSCNQDSYGDRELGSPAELSSVAYFTDTSTFSVIFSPAGKLATQDVRCRGRLDFINKDDQVFNTKDNIETKGYGMFLEDTGNYTFGIGAENSRKVFYILDKAKFNKMSNSQRWDYVDGLKPCTLNPYTGEIVHSR
jgi:prepilin-type N-terminal cleavage/methylation domain-containing protein